MLDQTSSRTSSRPSRVAILALLLASPFASACGSAVGDDTGTEGAVGASREAILGGADATMAEWGALVKVSNSQGTCSGALLSDTWVLTARHCIPNGHLANPPATPSLTIKNLNGVSRNVAQAFYMPGDYRYDPERNAVGTVETDVALLRLSTPFPLDFGKAYFGIHYLYPYANESLEGEQARCAGFGARELNGPSGKASWALIDVDSTWPDQIFLVPDDDGEEIQAPGDSGGPCVKQFGLEQFQFLVASGGTTDRNAAGEVIRIKDARGPGAESFRDWALGIMNFGVGLYKDRNFKGNAQTVANSAVSLSRVGDKQISSVRVPPGWQVNLWDTPVPGFGNSITLTGNVADMPSGWNDRVSSVEVLQNGVQIFRDPSFAGSTRTLAPGRYADLGTLNNNISSLRIPSDWRVQAYSEPGFAGRYITFYGSSIGSLGATFNDTFSSIVVEQPVTVFSDDLYFGDYQIFWEGPHNYTDMMVADKSISSIVVPAGFTVEAFEGENQTGASIKFTSSQPWMPEGWNERISSLRVRKIVE